MATTTEEIVSFIENKFPQNLEHLTIKNCQDRKFRFNVIPINQYIIGATKSDEFSNDIRHYEYEMKVTLNKVTQNVQCFPWPFSGYEKKEMKSVLSDLSTRFKVIMDTDEIINGLKIPEDESGTYYIVISVIQYEIAYVD